MLNDATPSRETSMDYLPPMPPNALDLDDLLDACERDIKQAYLELGQSLGWRFLTGPRSTLSPGIDIALITLNPGGNAQDAHQTGISFESGSAYAHESWGGLPAGAATLQRQVQSLFKEMMGYRGESGMVADYLATRVLTAHFIPFRSPSFAELHNAPDSIAFAKSLWSRVLSSWLPSTIITIDRETYSNVSQIIASKIGGSVTQTQVFATGWGQYSADGVLYRIPGRSRPLRLARLPHLSRFTLFAEPGYSSTRKDSLKPLLQWLGSQP